MDRAPRAVLRKEVRELESIPGQMASGSTYFDVFFKAVLTIFGDLWRFENVWCENTVLESIELVELHSESERGSWQAFLGESRRFSQNLMYFLRLC